MAKSKEHLRHILSLFPRRQESQTQKKICAVYNEDAVDDSTYYKWFRQFRKNNFSFKIL